MDFADALDSFAQSLKMKQISICLHVQKNICKEQPMQDEIDEAEDQFAAEICWFCSLNLFELFWKVAIYKYPPRPFARRCSILA